MTIDLKKLLEANTMARTPFELKYFVAGRHAHPMQRFRQIVCELGIADGAIRAADIARRKRGAKRVGLRIEMADLHRESTPRSLAREVELRCEVEELDLADEQEERALKGKRQEVATMLALLESEKTPEPVARVLEVFGRVPLFFYVAHIWLLRPIGIACAVGRYGLDGAIENEGAPGWPLYAGYVAWLAALVVLYPACRWFGAYKKKHQAERWWLRYL